MVVYRRTRDRMPAHDEEVEEALEEGMRMKWLSTLKHADGGRLTIERMRLDESGFPQPTGKFDELAADTVVLALGQDCDLSLLKGVPELTVDHGTVQVAEGLATRHQGIFAGGDMVPAERTVTVAVAVGHGKKVARHIDAYLRRTSYEPGVKHAPADFDRLNTWYYSDAPASVRPGLELARRVSTFDEVVQGLDESNALFEARRCRSCGNCFECDNCYGVCPDNAITKPGPGKGFAIDLDYCKGCGSVSPSARPVRWRWCRRSDRSPRG
ncbi:Pyridine nucleotide-disulphide oxidoreductase [Streptomyces sp. cf386]|nr:Pyridine nucleotide-disulphide oxidoreductase [Streptomyces sp. cf386]